MNIAEMMKQARQVQERMAALQEELAGKTVTGTAGGGMVVATVNGRGELVGVEIEEDLVRPGEVKMLQDLVVAAVNDGIRKAAELSRGEMAKLTGGVNIPGLF